MKSLFLLALAAMLGVQIDGPATPLTFDIRVFDGPTEVTRETSVAIYRAGERTGGRRLRFSETGAHTVAVRTGVYDLQVARARGGSDDAVLWWTLRVDANSPVEGQPQLEVLNFDRGYGALQLRPKQHSGARAASAAWSSRLLTKDGRDVATDRPGPGYGLLVAPAGVYDLVVSNAGTPERIHDVKIQPSITLTKRF